MEKGEKQKLNDAINYQNGSVVSKEIVKGGNGGITLFAFDKGQGLSEHTAPFDAMVQIFDGLAEIIISGRSNMVRSGEFIVMPANEPHALKANERFKMMLIMIKG